MWTFELRVTDGGLVSETVYSNVVHVRVVSPLIILSAYSGKVGSAVKVIGLGWVPGSTVTITLGGVTETNCLVSNFGTFSCGFNVPHVTAGTRTLAARDINGNSASVDFKVRS
jgi:hypothetical protein